VRSSQENMLFRTKKFDHLKMDVGVVL